MFVFVCAVLAPNFQCLQLESHIWYAVYSRNYAIAYCLPYFICNLTMTIFTFA